MATPHKQRQPRIDLRVSVQVQQESRLQRYFSKNLSTGGIFLEVEKEAPPIGSKLNLSFDIPGIQHAFRAKAEVVHHHTFDSYDERMRKSTKTGIGLRFLDLTPADEELIQKYVSGKDVRVRP
jgi:uncharacterized protein (TIGR02266 family)